jgi:ferredoxin-NADP reductase
MHINLVSKKVIAEGTTEFTFTRPESFDFKAGQSIDVTLINPEETDDEGNTRAFSLVSAPNEPFLKIATRMRDAAFKRTLNKLDEGAEVDIEGPFGSFFLHENLQRPAVFVCGGIGITPFHSMILDATSRNLKHELFLFFSNRNVEGAPFLEELQTLHQQNSNFTLIPTMTDKQTAQTVWQGEEGYIAGDMLKKYVSDISIPIYYLAGPQVMVTAMRGMLNDIGVSNDDIRFEEFSGY